MFLTDEEKSILNGDKGELLAEALDYLVQFGDAFGAERLIDIVYCNWPAEMAIYKGEIETACNLCERGAKVVVPTTSSTLCMDLDNPSATGIPKDLADKQKTIIKPHQKMGITPTYTCTPYLTGFLPPKGAYIACVESSAVIYYNSVLGCKTNRGGIFTRYSAITGKYPLMGYLLDENRKGTHLFKINLPAERLQTPYHFSLLGFAVGAIAGSDVPVFDFINAHNAGEQSNLIALGAALATSGSVSLFHIPGITPEANSVKEAFHGEKPLYEYEINENDIDNVIASLTTAEEPGLDFVLLGCPHYNLEQLRETAELLDGKKVHPNVRFWITTARMTKLQAKWAGYVDTIEAAGGKVITDTCAVESHMRLSTAREFGLPTPQIKTLVTDSTKQARYVKDLIGCKTVMMNRDDCVNAAINGRWK